MGCLTVFVSKLFNAKGPNPRVHVEGFDSVLSVSSHQGALLFPYWLQWQEGGSLAG